METKVCTTCGEEKTFDMFGKQKGGKEGLKPRCKECEKQYKKQYYIENKEHVSNHCRQYAKDNNIAIAKHHK